MRSPGEVSDGTASASWPASSRAGAARNADHSARPPGERATRNAVAPRATSVATSPGLAGRGRGDSVAACRPAAIPDDERADGAEQGQPAGGRVRRAYATSSPMSLRAFAPDLELALDQRDLRPRPSARGSCGLLRVGDAAAQLPQRCREQQLLRLVAHPVRDDGRPAPDSARWRSPARQPSPRPPSWPRRCRRPPARATRSRRRIATTTAALSIFVSPIAGALRFERREFQVIAREVAHVAQQRARPLRERRDGAVACVGRCKVCCTSVSSITWNRCGALCTSVQAKPGGVSADLPCRRVVRFLQRRSPITSIALPTLRVCTRVQRLSRCLRGGLRGGTRVANPRQVIGRSASDNSSQGVRT